LQNKLFFRSFQAVGRQLAEASPSSLNLLDKPSTTPARFNNLNNASKGFTTCMPLLDRNAKGYPSPSKSIPCRSQRSLHWYLHDHLDGFNMMSIPIPDTQYNGTIAWRTTIATIAYKGVSMHTFATPPAKIVSINCGFVSVSTSGGGLFFTPIGADSSFDLVSYSIVLVTQSINSIEMVTFSTPGTVSSTNGTILSGTSTKFTFGSVNDPY
jgi:hypothetical protein